MKRKDWLCKTCGMVMERNGRYLCCPFNMGHGKLIPAWGISDLPLAIKIDYKRYQIHGEEGFWEYVPHAHKDAMKIAPDPRVIIAKVTLQRVITDHRAARSFRRAKPPRKNRYHE
jgi:hypothetical protein